MQRISGRDVIATLGGGTQVKFEQININVDLGPGAVTSQGAPDGWVRGEVSADGDIQVVPEELSKINEEAEKAGSWEDMAAFDATFFADVGDFKQTVDVFGIKLNAPDFKYDGRGGDKLTHTIKFLVTDPDFIKLDGVPLARPPAADAPTEEVDVF